MPKTQIVKAGIAIAVSFGLLACNMNLVRKLPDWRGMQPRLSQSVASVATWSIQNENYSQFNVWSWDVPEGEERVYLYIRNIQTCDREGGPYELILIIAGDGDSPARDGSLVTAGDGVSLNLEFGRWQLLEGQVHGNFEHAQGKSLLILVDHWHVRRTHYYYKSRDQQRRAEEERRQEWELLEHRAARCRLETSAGPPGSSEPAAGSVEWW